MNKLIQTWHNSYYTDVIVTAVLIFALIVSVAKRKKFPQFRLLPYYFASFIFLQLFYFTTYILYPETSRRTINLAGIYIDAIVTLVEFAAFMYFLCYVILDAGKKKLMQNATKVLLVLFVLIFMGDFILSGQVRTGTLSLVYIIEAICISVGCFFYFRQLFTYFPHPNLIQQPDFWAATGLVFYAIGTLPVTFILDYFVKHDQLFYRQVFSVVYIIYILLYGMIIKAYYCKTAQQPKSPALYADPQVVNLNTLYNGRKEHY